MAEPANNVYIKLPKPTTDNVGKQLTIYGCHLFQGKLYIEDGYPLKKLFNFDYTDIPTSDDGSQGVGLRERRKYVLQVINYNDDPQWYLTDYNDNFSIDFSYVTGY